jgi:hypothetical protein
MQSAFANEQRREWSKGQMHSSAVVRIASGCDAECWPLGVPGLALRPPGTAVPMIRRERLVSTLTMMVSATQLTVVCARRGAGKTVLAAAWANDAAAIADVVWLTLGRDDVRPAALWWHVREGCPHGCNERDSA